MEVRVEENFFAPPQYLSFACLNLKWLKQLKADALIKFTDLLFSPNQVTGLFINSKILLTFYFHQHRVHKQPSGKIREKNMELKTSAELRLYDHRMSASK